MQKLSVATGLMSFLLSLGSAQAALTQVGDFRLSATDVATETYYDTFSFTTRNVAAAPVHINSAFTGTSQNANDGAVHSTDSPAGSLDISLATFSGSTRIRTLNRAASSATVARSGAVQWSFDLTPLASYLSTNGLKLDNANIVLNTTVTSGSPAVLTYDALLSFDGGGLTQTVISNDPSANYTTLTTPSDGVAGSTTLSSANNVGNKFYVLAQEVSAAQTLTVDIAALYNTGVRKFDLILSSSSFGTSRTFDISDGSGIFIATSPAPEPASLGLLGLGAIGLLRRVGKKSRS